MSDDYDVDNDDERMLALTHGPGGPAIIFVASYLALWFLFPLVWAVLTCGLLVVGFGLFTAKKILGVKSLWKALAISPLLGGVWIGFFYVLLQVLGV